MKHVYYIRHGLSEGNKAGVWSGRDNTPLAPEGLAQAKAAGEKARAEGLVFDVVISSPLDRAHHTAKHVAEATGYPLDNIVLLDDLIERGFGELERTVRDPAVGEAYQNDERYIERFKNVEPLADVHERAKRVVEYIKSRQEDTILIAGHGAFGRAIRRVINEQPLHIKGESIPNAEIFKLI